MTRYKPRLAITMGDPAGIGPEIIARAWSRFQTQPSAAECFVVGCPRVMEQAVTLIDADLRIEVIQDFGQVPADPDVLPVLAIRTPADEAPRGEISAVAGAAAAEALLTATDLALAGTIAGIVTAPLNKESLRAAGVAFPGHTELLGHRCGVNNVAMMLYLPPAPSLLGDIGLGVVHVTLHTALRHVFHELSSAAIVEKCRLATNFARAMLAAAELERSPRIGVAALNPHGGEHGLLGDEELTLIGPAVQQALREGCPVTGPLPCDTLMHRAAAGEFDVVVAMYHDQGHIALKLLGLHRAVNVTLGLPIVRTSVAHGTALDIAWQGRAQCDSLLQAIDVAQHLARHRIKG